LIVREILPLGQDIRNGVVFARDLVLTADPLAGDETAESESTELLNAIDEIEKLYRKAQQLRQKLQSISKQMKPKQHRTTRYELARTVVEMSRAVRSLPFSSPTRRALTNKIRAAVDEFRILEREIARTQRKFEESESTAAPGGRELKKDLRHSSHRIQQLEEECGASSTELRRTLHIVDRGEAEADCAKKQLIEANLRLVVSIGSSVPGPDPGRQHWSDEGRRQVRLSARIQVLDLRHLVGAPGYHQGHRGSGANDSNPCAYDRDD
jgi:RNA polymerase primary sigma factor